MLTPALRAPSVVRIPSSRTLVAGRRSTAARRATVTLPDLAVRSVMALLAGIILTASATHAPSIRLDRSTPAWTLVTSEIRAQGVGNCYHAALTLAMNARSLGLENVLVVQGTLMGVGEIEGYRFGHSWVEANVPGVAERVVLDFSSGASLVMDSVTYRFAQQAQDVHEYSVAQARTLASSGNYGPWTADVLAAWHA
jgi:hypothetical protein